MPFPDAAFDTVIPTFGVKFTPHHSASARELACVTRPGGTIGLVNWTPTGNAFYGPLNRARAPLAPDRWSSLNHELVELATSCYVAEDGSFDAPGEYLTVFAKRLASTSRSE